MQEDNHSQVKENLSKLLDKIRSKKYEIMKKFDFFKRYGNKQGIRNLYFNYKNNSNYGRNNYDNFIRMVGKVNKNEKLRQYAIKLAMTMDSFVSKMIVLCADRKIKRDLIEYYYQYRNNYRFVDKFRRYIDTEFKKAHPIRTGRNGSIRQQIKLKNIYNGHVNSTSLYY